MDEHLRKLGVEKMKVVTTNFDAIYDKYKKKAEDGGYFGEIKFKKERGKIVIFVVL